ncbi:MAG: aldehyde ferredoxin oxidoreductase family protein, partial [Nitrososphaeria archaeon]
MVDGLAGKVAEINLSENEIKILPTDENIIRKYLGGKGFCLAILYNELKKLEKKGIKSVDPFGPENVAVIATGPATGIPVFPTPGRFHVMALRSPLTGSVASANSGGDFGPYLKFAGYDALIIKGSSEKPIYISITDGEINIHDASNLWGRTVSDADGTLKRSVDGRFVSILSIGPAGENLVLFASLMNGYRSAARTGIGAIMGSKKIKAIIVSSSSAGHIKVFDPKKFKEFSRKSYDKHRENLVTSTILGMYGTASAVNLVNQMGILTYKNFQYGYHSNAEKISGEIVSEKYLLRRSACWGCMIACGRVTQVKSGPYQILKTEGPEFETIALLGSATGVDDLEAIIKANHLCNDLGLDTISMGSTIATAMELYEKGYINNEITDNIEFKFGNASAVVEAVWRTAYKAGFGKYLALGSKRLAELFNAPELSMSVKGLEIAAYDPRGSKGMGLGYATSNRGGCHVTGYVFNAEALGIPEKLDPLSIESKAKWVKWFQDFT